MAEYLLTPGTVDSLEMQIDHWRSYLQRRPAMRSTDIEELEGHLRDQVATLRDTGLSNDEAFLVAMKRMGALDAISSEFAREHSERLWKQLVMSHGEDAVPAAAARYEMIVVFGLAVVAAILIKLPALFGLEWGGKDMPFYMRNLGFFVLPVLAGYFVWKRGLGKRAWMWAAAGFAAALVIANLYSFEPQSNTLVLTVLHASG